MTGRAYLPRRLEFEDLVKVLVQEHAEMQEGLSRVKDAAERRDFREASKALRELDPVFRQHIVDEESTVLRLLLRELGVKKAQEEIKVFQQHRPIYRLMQAVAELASRSAVELRAEQARLSTLFLQHTSAEEEGVFPKAIACYKGTGRPDKGNPD